MSKKTNKEPIGLVLSNQKEKDEARKISIEYGIKILYEDIFSKENNNHLYLFDENGIALGGTYIFSRVKLVLHGAKEYEEYLKQKSRKETSTDLLEEVFKRLGLKAKFVEKSGCSGVLKSKDIKATK